MTTIFERARSTRLLLRLLLVLSVVTTIGCDRLTKRIASETLMGSPGRSFLGDTVQLVYAENTGGFLSLGEQLPPRVRRAVFVGGTGVLLIVLLVGLVRGSISVPRREIAVAGVAFFVAGGLSNWIDRFAHGRVVDFMVMRLGPLHTGIFNVADVAIVFGVGLIALAHFTSTAKTSDGVA